MSEFCKENNQALLHARNQRDWGKESWVQSHKARSDDEDQAIPSPGPAFWAQLMLNRPENSGIMELGWMEKAAGWLEGQRQIWLLGAMGPEAASRLLARSERSFIEHLGKINPDGLAREFISWGGEIFALEKPLFLKACELGRQEAACALARLGARLDWRDPKSGMNLAHGACAHRKPKALGALLLALPSIAKEKDLLGRSPAAWLWAKEPVVAGTEERALGQEESACLALLENAGALEGDALFLNEARARFPESASRMEGGFILRALEPEEKDALSERAKEPKGLRL